jgi:hypothetical protein
VSDGNHSQDVWLESETQHTPFTTQQFFSSQT